MSFAKVHNNHDSPEPKLTVPPQVAAMHVPNPQKPSNNLPEDKKVQPKEPTNRRSTVVSPKPRITSPPPQTTPQPAKAEFAVRVPSTNGDDVAIEGLSQVNKVSLAANGIKTAESNDSIDDDQSHLSNSSTKQQSFETKSMASVTTFAMDEKESIRPDDSASVRAIDDEDTPSTLSQNSTFQQEASVIMPTLRGGAGVPVPLATIAARRYPTLTNPPRFGDLEPPAPQSEISQTTSSSAIADQQEEPSLPIPLPPVSPDEKLLDALASPKDRLSILQLEERLLVFTGQSNIEFIDLPPQNSYARLLAHKLADYYGLHHHINEDGTSIRVFRTISGSPPTPLAVLAQSIPVGSSQSLPTAVKIMRRAGIGPRQFSTTNSTAPSSSGIPSKATSDAGHSEEGVMSPTEASTPSRDKTKMTREEREAQYKAARERIFGDFQELSIGENASTGENSADMSRSSSSSGKKKMRKQKTPKDDSFDSRSAFVAGYGGVHVQPVQAPYQPQQYVSPSYTNQYEGSSGGYGHQMDYGSTPTQQYSGFDQNIPMTNSMAGSTMAQPNFNMVEDWSNVQPQQGGPYFNYPQTQNGYQQNMPPPMQQMNSQYMQQAPPSMQQPMGWMNNQYQTPYQQPQMGPAQPPPNWSHFQPQQYGQMPGQYGMAGPMGSQGPLPGNYNRSLFNPQTRPFQPGSGGPRPKGSRKKNPPISNQPQSRNISATKSHMSSTSPAMVMPPRGPSQDLARSDESSSSKMSQESLQKKYGAPAHLPKKPPPTRSTSQFDVGGIGNVKAPRGAVGNGNVSNGNAEGGATEAPELVSS